MNKSLLKFITYFGPLLIFFTIYYKSGNNLTVAIPPLIIATLIAVIIMYFVEKKNPLRSTNWWDCYLAIWWANFIF